MTQEYVIRTAEQLSPVIVGLRRERGLTQSQLGARLGLSQKTYSALELGVERTSVARLLALVSALGYELVLRDKHSTGPEAGSGQSVEW